MLAGAAALALAGPASAKPGNGHGNGNGYGHGHGHGHGYDNDRGIGYGGGCPPGLAKKHNGCMPPGQAKKLYRGERWRNGYGNYYTYGRIPYEVRRRYRLSSRYRYYYNDGYLYAVDPRTMLIQQVISALLR
jgi:hypothetical protein